MNTFTVLLEIPGLTFHTAFCKVPVGNVTLILHIVIAYYWSGIITNLGMQV